VEASPGGGDGQAGSPARFKPVIFKLKL
jgi:hypothetical protein